MQDISPTVFSVGGVVVTGGDEVEAGEVTHQPETQVREIILEIDVLVFRA